MNWKGWHSTTFVGVLMVSPKTLGTRAMATAAAAAKVFMARIMVYKVYVEGRGDFEEQG